MSNIGYLTPEGKIIECESYEHLSLASELIDKMIETGIEVPSIAKTNGVEAEGYLLSLGYIAIRAKDCYGYIGYHIEEGMEKRLHMTEKQKKWLLSHYEEFSSEKQRCVDELFAWDQ